jgi:hypothetical protein
MAANENGNPRADGASIAIPVPSTPFSIGGTYYWNPGSPTAPSVTLSGGLGYGGGGVQGVFLRKGMTSQDTLGYGASGTASAVVFPSATVNVSIPDQHGIPQPWNARVSSVESGAALPGFGVSYTVTPRQIADFITTHGLIGAARLTSTFEREALAAAHPSMHFISPAMGPNDELSPLVRNLQTGRATIGPPTTPPVPLLAPSRQKPLGDGMGDWSYSAGPAKSPPTLPPGLPRGSSVFDVGASPVAFPPPPGKPGGLPGLMTDAGLLNSADPDQPPPGGVPGLIVDYLRNNRVDDASR